jgi:hypothetical protein
MKLVKKTIFIKTLIAFILSVPLNVLSQTDTTAVVSGSDISRSAGSEHTLYSILGYGSNMIYLGSTISQNQPFGYAALTYGYKDAIYATVSAVHLSDRTPFVAFFTGSINYSHVFNSWFDLSAGISRYQVATSLTDTLFNNFLYGDLTLGFDWKLLYTKLSAGGLFSEESVAYFQVRNSRFFQTPEFSKKRVFFSFDPYVNFLFGSLTRAETTIGTTITISPPFRKKGNNNSSSSSSSTKYTTVLGIMEVDLGVPISFNSNRFTIEAEPGYILPIYDDPEYPGMKGFLFLLTGYFKIF